ncbi:hypothetical protein [Kribbella pittospori]|uniref:hypothetical protein n=1 Tax=Kribbella pittospori TaxID=722689 RepID=UPI0013F3B654|nr:hypothetical protein [Kribbella pittospori]
MGRGGAVEAAAPFGDGFRLNLATYETAQFPAPTFPGAAQVVPHHERGSRHRL